MGCSFGESGVTPPLDGLFLPTSVAVDPSGDWLFIVNSNSDLRYNAGTVAVADLRKLAEDRARTDWIRCPGASFRPSGPAGTRFCCYDYHDTVSLNCDERGYVVPGATARIGSFGSAIVVDSDGPSGTHRLFVSVRAEPSITFIDAQLGGGQVHMSCNAGTAPNPTCDDSHKIRGGTDPQGPLVLPEEPFSLALDQQLGILYATHGGRGISVIEACAGQKPALSSVTWPAFAHETCTGLDPVRCQGVNGVLLGQAGNPTAPLYAFGRFIFADQAAEVQTLLLRGADRPCGEERRHLELVPGDSFFPSAFYPYGNDIRGMVLSADGKRAYVLHRNGAGISARDNPAALVAVDRTPDSQGRPINRAVEVVEICSGPTELHLHDAGRGPRLHVVCFESGQIYVVDPDLMEVSAVINVGRGPNNLAFAPQDPTLAYLAGFSDNNVSVIDLRPGSPNEYKVVQRIGFPTLRR